MSVPVLREPKSPFRAYEGCVRVVVFSYRCAFRFPPVIQGRLYVCNIHMGRRSQASAFPKDQTFTHRDRSGDTPHRPLIYQMTCDTPNQRSGTQRKPHLVGAAHNSVHALTTGGVLQCIHAPSERTQPSSRCALASRILFSYFVDKDLPSFLGQVGPARNFFGLKWPHKGIRSAIRAYCPHISCNGHICQSTSAIVTQIASDRKLFQRFRSATALSRTQAG